MSERLNSTSEATRENRDAGATRRMALVRTASSSAASNAGNSAADLLLSDFHDALRAYTRLSAYASEESRCPVFVRAECTPNGSPRILERPECESETCDIASCDTIVLAHEVASPADCAPLADVLHALASSNALNPTTRFYAIICDSCSSEDTAAAREAVRACQQVDACWSGAVVVTDAQLIPRLMRVPRLGMWRRPVARAIDRLVAAVRMSCALDELDELLGVDPERANTSNVLVASPHPLWRTIASRMR